MRTDSYLNDFLLRSAFQGMSKLYKYLKILTTEFFLKKKKRKSKPERDYCYFWKPHICGTSLGSEEFLEFAVFLNSDQLEGISRKWHRLESVWRKYKS